jgi:LAO/AO transport system kinase
MRPQRLPLSAYLEGLLAGERRLLSQAITLVESARPEDEALARQLVEACLPHSGKAFRLGISGPPGVGKSTFIDSFGSLLTARGEQVAVLAIDPSSRLTRGSILGDKTRMERLSQDPRAFIRPSPSSGALGGVARKTRETMILCEAAGFGRILVETVGVGQSEVAVAGMTDFFLLLLLPNAGDDLQGIKKGVMELADGFVVHKADGDYMASAREAQALLSQVARMMTPAWAAWRPPALLCSSQDAQGHEAILSMLDAFRAAAQAEGTWEQRRRQQALAWFRDMLRQWLELAFFQMPAVAGLLPRLEKAVAEQACSPAHAALELIEAWQVQLRAGAS